MWTLHGGVERDAPQGLLIPLARSGDYRAGVVNAVLILLICGLLALAIRWDRARQPRRRENPALYNDDDRRIFQPEYKEEGVTMTHLYVAGMNGQIEVDDEWVRIHRKGLIGRMGRGAGNVLGRGTQIRLSDIQDIEISYPRLTQRGWIRFLTGGEERMGLMEAGKDDSTVLFTKRQQQAIDQFRQQLKGLLARHTNEGLVEAIAEGVAASSRVDFATQLRDLAALRDEGLLSEEEFQLKKTQLLRDA